MVHPDLSLVLLLVPMVDLALYVASALKPQGLSPKRGILSYPYFSQSQLRSNLGPPDLSLGIDTTPDLVWPSPAQLRSLRPSPPSGLTPVILQTDPQSNTSMSDLYLPLVATPVSVRPLPLSCLRCSPTPAGISNSGSVLLLLLLRFLC